MQFNRLGRTGLKVSNMCLGTMQFGWTADQTTASTIMDKAVDLGCNFFDTADIYSRWVDGNDGGVSEIMIGNWLSQDKARRQQLVLATKVRGMMGTGPNDQGLSRGHIMDAVDASLRRLQTDYIDLYQVHAFDPDTPLEETMQALDDLVRCGKVRYLGCSNFAGWQLMKALGISAKSNLARFESVQPHYNLAHRAEFERSLQAVCADQSIAVIPYSPLAAGFLTGKYTRDAATPSSPRVDGIRHKYLNETGYQVIEAMQQIANDKGATVAQLAIAWILANPTVTSAITGANSLEQLTDTFAGSDLTLSAEEKAKLDQLTAWHDDNQGPNWS